MFSFGIPTTNRMIILESRETKDLIFLKLGHFIQNLQSDITN